MTDIIKIKRMARQKNGHQHTNHKKAAFCTQCGEALDTFEELTEYKCEGCDFIIEKNDKFCPECGENLTDNGVTIYVDGGVELTEVEFNKIKATKKGKKVGAKLRRLVS